MHLEPESQNNSDYLSNSPDQPDINTNNELDSFSPEIRTPAKLKKN